MSSKRISLEGRPSAETVTSGLVPLPLAWTMASALPERVFLEGDFAGVLSS